MSACDRAEQPAARQGHGRLTMAGSWNITGDLPDVSKCLRGVAQAGDRQATLHGVVFDILVGSENHVGLGRPPLSPHHAAAISSGTRAPVMKATASDMV